MWIDGVLDAIHKHLDIVDLTGLQLADFIRECWARRASRPTARELSDRLITLKDSRFSFELRQILQKIIFDTEQFYL